MKLNATRFSDRSPCLTYAIYNAMHFSTEYLSTITRVIISHLPVCVTYPIPSVLWKKHFAYVIAKKLVRCPFFGPECERTKYLHDVRLDSFMFLKLKLCPLSCYSIGNINKRCIRNLHFFSKS